MKTLRFMMHNYSLKTICIAISVWVVLVPTVVIVIELIKGWNSFAATFDAIKEIAPTVAVIGCFCAYEFSRGKMKGIDAGKFTERTTWTKWYKKHQEQIKEHNIEIKEPTTSELPCPKCGANHDLLKV